MPANILMTILPSGAGTRPSSFKRILKSCNWQPSRIVEAELTADTFLLLTALDRNRVWELQCQSVLKVGNVFLRSHASNEIGRSFDSLIASRHDQEPTTGSVGTPSCNSFCPAPASKP